MDDDCRQAIPAYFTSQSVWRREKAGGIPIYLGLYPQALIFGVEMKKT